MGKGQVLGLFKYVSSNQLVSLVVADMRVQLRFEHWRLYCWVTKLMEGTDAVGDRNRLIVSGAEALVA
jgi:hypothetical protein